MDCSTSAIVAAIEMKQILLLCLFLTGCANQLILDGIPSPTYQDDLRDCKILESQSSALKEIVTHTAADTAKSAIFGLIFQSMLSIVVPGMGVIGVIDTGLSTGVLAAFGASNGLKDGIFSAKAKKQGIVLECMRD